MVRERLTRKQLTSRPDHLWPEICKSMRKNAKLKEKQKWSNEKPQLDNARELRGIYFIDPEDTELKETISRMLARSWKQQWLPLCLARSARIIRIVGMVQKNPIKSNQTCVYSGSQ